MGRESARLGAAVVALGLLAGSVVGCKKPPQQPAQGALAQVEKLGQTLAGAPEVPVDALFKSPTSFEGKIIRVSGKVEDFCVHKRAWFAVHLQEGMPMVRVFTSPRFLVPADAKGKRAVAEGRVEVIVIPPDQVDYYAKEHQFLANVERKPGESVRLPIVRAFGAEFQSD